MNLNKVFVLGRVTADPQLKSTGTGQSVASFSIATNRVWNDRAGAKKESTEFHNIVVWGRQAEIASQFLKKGSLVLIEGRLQTRSWQDNQGQTRRVTEIICERIQLGPRPSGQGNFEAGSEAKDNSASNDELRSELPAIDIGDDEIKPEDLPF